MNKQEIMEGLVAAGWKKDRFGHLQLETGKNKYRLKFQAISIRMEVQCKIPATLYSKAQNTWIKVGGGFYSKVELKSNRLIVGNRHFAFGLNPA